MKIKYIFATVILGISTQSLAADEILNANNRREILSNITGLQGDQNVAHPGAHLTTSNAGGAAEITVELVMEGDVQDEPSRRLFSLNSPDKSHRGENKDSSMVFSISTPTSKNTDKTKLATLDGLADATAIKAEWNKVINYPMGKDTKWYPTVNVKLAEAYKEASYYDKLTLAENKITTKPWSADLSIGSSSTVKEKAAGEIRSVKFIYTVESTQDDNPSSILCPAPTGTTPFTCVTGPIGAPTRSISHMASLGVSYIFPKYAITPTINRKLVDKTYITGIDFPMYLVKDEKNNFTSGIDFGWRSDTHKTVIGIFVGAALKE